MYRWFPIFSRVDITQHEHPLFVKLRTAYAELRPQRMRIQRTYDEFKQDLSHYCDRTTVTARFRPANLISEAAMPPFEQLFDGTSDISPPPPTASGDAPGSEEIDNERRVDERKKILMQQFSVVEYSTHST